MRRYAISGFVLTICCAAFAACGAEAPLPADGTPYAARSIDGDTVAIQIGSTEEIVRLVGIDAPETVHPTRPTECFGPEASAHVAEHVPRGTPLRLEHDREARDAFGRLLLYVWLPDGRFLNEELVALGLAKTLFIAPNTAYAERLRAAEHAARGAGRGLWGACEQTDRR